MKAWYWDKGGDCSLKKLIILILAFFFLLSSLTAQTDETNNYQEIIKKQLQLQKSIESTLSILEEMEKFNENSIDFKRAITKLRNKQARHDFVVDYYNNLVMIEKNPKLEKHPEEQKARIDLLFQKANRIYKEKYIRRGWLEQSGEKEINRKFLEHYLVTDRFMVLVLRIHEKNDKDFKKTKKFFDEALLQPDPMAFILADLRENIQITAEIIYKMKKGDDLSKVANKFGRKWEDIAKHNKIKKKDLRRIPIDREIRIPQRTIIPKDANQLFQIALSAEEQTNVAADLILAVREEETGLRFYVGGGNYHDDMKPEEKPIFLEICLKLGLDPETTPVSKKPRYGSGGAMGFAQTLPSVWKVRGPKVAALNNRKYASPFNLKDAVFAIASELASVGATTRIPYLEEKSVMVYFAGGNWDKIDYYWYWEEVNQKRPRYRRKLAVIREKIRKEQEKQIN